MQNAITNIAHLAADCFTAHNQLPTNRCTTNLLQIGEIANQELSGRIKVDIGNVLCENYCGVVVAQKILRICNQT